MRVVSNITNAFFKLYSTKDFEDITTKEIIKLAGCNNSTFYDYYFDKYYIVETTKHFLLEHVTANSDLYLSVFLNRNDLDLDMKSIKYVHKYSDYLRPLLNKDLNFVNAYKNTIKSIYADKLIYPPFEDHYKHALDDQNAASITYQTLRYLNRIINKHDYLVAVKYIFKNAALAPQQEKEFECGKEHIPVIKLRKGSKVGLV